MSRSTRLLPLLLLAFPMTAPGQGAAELSPALRGKLLAQNAPAGQPAGAPDTASTDKPARRTVVPPTAAPAATPAEAPAIPAAVPAPATPAATPAPPVVIPPTATPGSVTPGTPSTRAPRTIPGRPPINIPGRTPGATTGLRPPGAPGAPVEGSAEAIEENGMWEIAFKDATIEEVIGKYEEISGRHVLRGSGLQAQLTFASNPQSPMTPEEAIEFLKAGLLLQGVVIQPYSKNIDKVLMLQGGSPLQEPPKDGGIIYTKVADLPEEEQPVSFLLTLKHLPVDEAVAVLAQAIPNHQWTKLIAVPTSNSIFVHESVSNVRTLVRAVEKMDLPPVKLVHEWVELERASAEDVQSILDQILQAQAQGKGKSGASGFRSISPAAAAANLQPGMPQPVAAPAAGGAASGQMPDGSNMIVKADPRTNRVFLNGPQDHVDYLKKLIREFDEPSRVKNLLTQQLRYIPVGEFFELAVTSLEATGAGQAGAGGGASSSGGSARSTGGRSGAGDFGGGGSTGSTGGNFRSDFASRSSGSSSGGIGGAGGSSRSTRQGVGSSGGSGGGTTEAPRAQTIGKTLLISDPRTNSLIVSGPPDSIQRVGDLVKEMDKRPYQVHINAVIAQMTISDDMQTAVDILSRLRQLDIGGRTIDLSGFVRNTGAAASPFINPADLAAAGAVAGGGLNLYAASAGLFNGYVKALETSGNSRLLAKPHITVANNEVGTISSGQRIPIPSNQQSTITNGNTQSLNSSVEYENVVLSLNVTPLINSNNEITLDISQLNDTVGAPTTINGNPIPSILTQELETRLTVPNGGIIMLGGLISENRNESRSGVPFLSKIPVLKRLFSTNGKKKDRYELVILLQATIAEGADDLVNINANELQRTVVGTDAVNFAKPERKTEDLVLPTYEKDVPFDTPDAGQSVEITEPAPLAKKKKSRK